MTTKPKHGLVQSWLEFELSTPGARKSIALCGLNEDMGTNYSLSRLGEWANGVRPIPEPVRLYMLHACIAHVICTHINLVRISDEQLHAIADALS